MWTLALIISAMNVETVYALVLIAVFALVAVLVCVVWMWLYKHNHKSSAGRWLLVGFAASVASLIVSLTASQPEDARICSSVFYGMVSTWLLCASMFQYLEINVGSCSI
jgi:chromate transport protein ChrA